MSGYQWFQWVGTVLVSACLGVGIDQAITPKIVTVNISQLVDDFVKATAKEHVPQEELEKRVALFSSQIEESIQQMAKNHNVMIVPKEAVIAGAKDVTDELTKKP